MKNLSIYLPLVDGSCYDMEFSSGKELIAEMVGSDWGPPPRHLVFEAVAEDGRVVTLSISNNSSDRIHVSINDES